jgi:hypothetical protein
MSATTQPVLSGSAFSSEYHVMILLGAGAVAPLLGLAAMGAIAHQDVGGLVRTALLRLPMALLLTGAVVELVSLGLRFTDGASAAVLSTGDHPAARAFAHIEVALAPASASGFGFGQLVLVVVVAFVGFLLWVELAVRSAAVAAATLFLPLALAGLVWPATSHWARRLGETLAGLVFMKLVMAAVLALAGGALAAGAGGLASVVEGVALLGLTAFAPFALFRLIPIVENGAASHVYGSRPAQAARDRAWSLAADGAQWVKGAVAGSSLPALPAGQAGMTKLPGPGASLFGGARDGSSGGRAGAGSTGAPDHTAGYSGGGRGTAGDGVSGASSSGKPASSAGTAARLGEQGWREHISARRSRSRGS